MDPLHRCLDEALCLEYQLQNASVTLSDREDLTPSARDLLGRLRAMATDHIVELDPHVVHSNDERREIAREIAGSEMLLGTTLPAPPSFHLREIYGLVDQAALAYEALLFVSRAARQAELGVRAERGLTDCVHALGDLEMEIPASVVQEVESAGGALSGPEFDDCVKRIASVWEKGARP